MLMINGKTFVSIDGLTPAQAIAVEMATRCAPRAWHDNLIVDISTALGGAPPYANAAVSAAMLTALSALGINSPLLPP